MARWLLLLVGLVATVEAWHVFKPLPPGLSLRGELRPLQGARFLADLTFVDEAGQRHVEQTIFDEVLAMIRASRERIVLDMFLFNDFQGDVPEKTRALSAELTLALLAHLKRHPEVEIVLVTDPINTVYGGLRSEHLEDLQAGGVHVVTTLLEPLRDSNPVYSSVWRWAIQPFGRGGFGTLPNPFGAGRVSLRTYLRMLNFKANHRKVILADSPGSPDAWAALVTSANPHDGSSAHGNVALRFAGRAVGDLLESEQAVLDFSGGPTLEPIPASAEPVGDQTLRVLTEGRIGEALDELLASTRSGDRLDVAVFYLSDRAIVRGLIEAHERGASVRVLLDANKDAFGREKNGVPNRPVAAELVAAGIPVRWCDTHGEQCHAKLMIRRRDDRTDLIVGSANFTQRNLRDANLETNVALSGATRTPALYDAAVYFERVWSNEPGRRYSSPYEAYADESGVKRAIYRFTEFTGIGTY